jgi:hypothetical protein
MGCKHKTSNEIRKHVEIGAISSTFSINFPKDGKKVEAYVSYFHDIVSNRNRPVFCWKLEDVNENGSSNFFVTKSFVTGNMKRDAMIFENGYYSILEIMLKSSLENYVTNPQINKIENDSLFILEYFNNNINNLINIRYIHFRIFTNDEDVYEIGVINNSKNDIENERFINSFKIKKSKLKIHQSSFD